MKIQTTRRLLLASTMICGTALGLSAPAFAQDTASATEVQEIVVTGSRIPRPNLEQPTPVSALSNQQIENAGPQNLGDIISQLPAVGFSGTVRANSNNFGNGAGLSFIDLRDLGVSRTLVLVNGQRHVAGDVYTNAVDVNSIPTSLVDHVEVTTGGASAIYGSDAVSGVVNIILKKNFQGIGAKLEGGAYDNGFGAKYDASITVGRNFLDDKLNVALSGFWTKEAGIDARNLPAAHNYGRIINPRDVTFGTLDPTYYTSPQPIRQDSVADYLYVPNVGSDYVALNGVLIDAYTFNPLAVFTPDGRVLPPPVRTGYNSFAFAQLPADCVGCYFTEDYEQLASPLESKGVNLNANYDFNDHLHATLDAKMVQTDTHNFIQPSFTFADYQLQPDNAFITPEIADLLAASTDPDAEGADYPFIGKFVNIGRGTDIRRRTYRAVLGLNGDFDVGLFPVTWDAALNYGETRARIVNLNLEISENFAAAFDSVIDPDTGDPACRINVPSAPQTGFGEDAANPEACVPYNPFGQQNGAAVMGYSFGNFLTHDKLAQEDANVNLSTNTGRFFNFQGGPLAIALGAEYRLEQTRSVNDPRLVNGETENLAGDSSGGFNVSEAYVELNAPFFKDKGPFLSELSVDAAYRAASYSTVGDASAYKFSGVYGPVDWFKLRTTYSRAIRAPNITEAFLPETGGFFDIYDPCDVTNISDNINYAANCAAAGIPADFTSQTNESPPGVSSGNPNLDPEKSFSYTAGFIMQPHFLPGLAVTADYYSIKIKNAITLVDAQDIINNCYNSSGGLDDQYCGLFTRGDDLNINFIHTTYVNSSKLSTDGVDLQVDYGTDVSDLTSRWRYTQALTGRLTFSLQANYTFHYRVYPFQNNPSQVHIYEGTQNDPHLKGLFSVNYRQGPWQVAWDGRYIGRMANFDRDATTVEKSESSDVPFLEQTFYHNLAVRYDFGGRLDGTEAFAGVNNLFGEEPPYAVIGTGLDLGYELGRFIFAGVKIRR